jgi:hypothetical protein
MDNLNFFQFVCFFWAFVGIISRIAMVIMGKKWKEWELKKVYKDKKPFIIYKIGILGYLFVGFTWYKVFTTDVKFSWVIALLISLTLIKITTLIFNYESFRKFAVKTLNDRKKMITLNIIVLIFSMVLISMGLFLYKN